MTRYKRESEQYDVIVQTSPSGRNSPDDIEKIFVRGKGDAMSVRAGKTRGDATMACAQADDGKPQWIGEGAHRCSTGKTREVNGNQR